MGAAWGRTVKRLRSALVDQGTPRAAGPCLMAVPGATQLALKVGPVGAASNKQGMAGLSSSRPEGNNHEVSILNCALGANAPQR